MMLFAMASAERAARAIRRADKQMSDERARETFARGYAGRLGTVGPDGWPYVVPRLPLPAPADRGPRADHTKTPHARP